MVATRVNVREFDTTTAERRKRLPMLDGLRAVSIALVLFSHLQGTRGFPAFAGVTRLVGDLGMLGVRVFFVLSGFLITHLLIAELRRNGRISLADFYARRAIRILPALAVFLLCIFVAARLGWLFPTRKDWIHALTFTMDYSPHPAWSLGHLWSLSVEEQFYLGWPAVLALLGTTRALGFAAAVVVALPVLRVLLWTLAPGYRDYMDQSFETVADALATGCLLARVRQRLGSIAAYQRLMTSRAFVLVPIVVFLVNGRDTHPIAFMFLGQTIMNVGIALILDWSLRHDDGHVGRVLESAPARYVGARSYSLYLWQEPFLNHRMTAFATTFPFNLVFACAAALFSYAFVERPMSKLRGRFSR